MESQRGPPDLKSDTQPPESAKITTNPNANASSFTLKEGWELKDPTGKIYGPCSNASKILDWLLKKYSSSEIGARRVRMLQAGPWRNLKSVLTTDNEGKYVLVEVEEQPAGFAATSSPIPPPASAPSNIVGAPVAVPEETNENTKLEESEDSFTTPPKQKPAFFAKMIEEIQQKEFSPQFSPAAARSPLEELQVNSPEISNKTSPLKKVDLYAAQKKVVQSFARQQRPCSLDDVRVVLQIANDSNAFIHALGESFMLKDSILFSNPTYITWYLSRVTELPDWSKVLQNLSAFDGGPQSKEGKELATAIFVHINDTLHVLHILSSSNLQNHNVAAVNLRDGNQGGSWTDGNIRQAALACCKFYAQYADVVDHGQLDSTFEKLLHWTHHFTAQKESEEEWQKTMLAEPAFMQAMCKLIGRLNANFAEKTKPSDAIVVVTTSGNAAGPASLILQQENIIEEFPTICRRIYKLVQSLCCFKAYAADRKAIWKPTLKAFGSCATQLKTATTALKTMALNQVYSGDTKKQVSILNLAGMLNMLVGVVVLQCSTLCGPLLKNMDANCRQFDLAICPELIIEIRKKDPRNSTLYTTFCSFSRLLALQAARVPPAKNNHVTVEELLNAMQQVTRLVATAAQYKHFPLSLKTWENGLSRGLSAAFLQISQANLSALRVAIRLKPGSLGMTCYSLLAAVRVFTAPKMVKRIQKQTKKARSADATEAFLPRMLLHPIAAAAVGITSLAASASTEVGSGRLMLASREVVALSSSLEYTLKSVETHFPKLGKHFKILSGLCKLSMLPTSLNYRQRQEALRHAVSLAGNWIKALDKNNIRFDKKKYKTEVANLVASFGIPATTQKARDIRDLRAAATLPCSYLGCTKYLSGGIIEKKTCSGCCVARYCSKECQKRDWDGHQRVCKAVMTRREKKTLEQLQKRHSIRNGCFCTII